MFEHYLAGFFDGEGSLIIRFKKDERYRAGYQIEPKINISQKDKHVLELIQNRLGMGKLYYHKRDDLWHYNVQKFDDIARFVSLIKNKVIVKRRQLERFEMCIDMLTSKRHLDQEGVKAIKKLWSAPDTEANTR